MVPACMQISINSGFRGHTCVHAELCRERPGPALQECGVKGSVCQALGSPADQQHVVDGK